jgi:hypothetical protein
MADPLFELPLDVSSAAVDLLTVNKDRLALRSLDRLPRSIDNMSPAHPFVRTPAALPIVDGVAPPPTSCSIDRGEGRFDPIRRRCSVRASHCFSPARVPSLSA